MSLFRDAYYIPAISYRLFWRSDRRGERRLWETPLLPKPSSNHPDYAFYIHKRGFEQRDRIHCEDFRGLVPPTD